MNHFYTYAYLREDRTPYYIGRGSGRRVHSPHKRRNGRIIPVPPKNRILILKSNLTFEQSVNHEMYMIHVLGRKDLNTGILRNASNGGEGNLGHRHTKSTLQRMSEKRKGVKKSIEWRMKISESHIGITHTPETKQKLSEMHTGKKWWVNPSGDTTLAFTPPDSSYIRGRKYK